MPDDYNNENYISDNLLRIQLALLRKNSGLTQKDMHEMTGLSLKAIHNIENGEDTYPTLKSIIKYMDALGYEFKLVKKKI